MFFKCLKDGCDMKFTEKKDRNDHYREHERNSRPFQCNKCGQGFTQISSLQKHGRVHDKRKPYICQYEDCGMAFTQASNLIRHERIHTGVKPYKCDRCDKSFASSSNLKQHKEIHQRENDRQRFVCPVGDCGKVYLYFSSLKKHLSKNHGDYYHSHFNQPSKLEIQSFKKMTTQTGAMVGSDEGEEVSSEKSDSFVPIVESTRHKRKAKNEALVKLQKHSSPNISEELLSDEEAKEPLNESSHSHQFSQNSQSSKQEKSENEYSVKDTKVKRSERIDSDEIKQRIQETLQKDSFLNQKFETLNSNFNKVSGSSNKENEMSKRQETLQKQSSKKKDASEAAQESFSRLPTLESLHLGPQEAMPNEEKQCLEMLSQILTANNQRSLNLNPLTALLNPDTELLLKSIIMQDLFTNAFKRLLYTSRVSILQNLTQSVGQRMGAPSPLPLDALRKQLKTQRKNTDPVSSDTIESDMPNRIKAPKNVPSASMGERQQASLSSFFPLAKNRAQSMFSQSTKQGDANWDPKEERKQ